MKRIVKLNEKDLSRIVKRLIKEDYSNLDEYDNKYSELVNKLSNLVSELDSLAEHFEKLSEEVYSQIDEFTYDDKEELNNDLDDIAQSSMSYAEIINRCINKITLHM